MIVALVAAALSAGAMDDLGVDRRLRDLAAAHPRVMRLSTVGTSRQGRAIPFAWLTDQAGGDSPAPADRPALIIIAGLNAMHRVGIETAIGVAERLAAEQ